MTRRRINVVIRHLTVSGGELSEQALDEAVRAELGIRLHGLGSTGLMPEQRLVAALDVKATTGADGLGAGVGQAIARATAGVLKS